MRNLNFHSSIIQVVGEEENQGRAGTMPCRKEEDLLLTYRVLIDDANTGMASFQVTNEAQKMLGVSEEELYQAAIRNTPKMLPPQIKSMDAIIWSSLTEDKRENGDFDAELKDLGKEPGMYVLTNTSKMYGAATIFYPDVMDKIADAFGYDMVVLPSSLHEVILIPNMPELGINMDEMKTMVSEVNDTTVEPEERLPNQAYVYDRAEKKLMIGSEWEQQKALKSQQKQSIKESLKQKKEQVESGRGAPDKKSLDNDMTH